MNQLNDLNKALTYIEENLDGEIDYAAAARKALCSEFHFKRMFSFLAGVSISEYVRRRRLTLAAFELNQNEIRIVDAAVKYGYHSPDAFTRAFQQLHGLAPSEARQNSQQLKAYPPMTFQLSIKGGESMNYRMEEKQGFYIAGIHKRVSIVFEGENPEIAEMWKSLTKEKIQELQAISSTDPKGLIQASTNFSEGRMREEGGLDHYIGAAVSEKPDGSYDTLSVPPLTWAVFEVSGPFPETLQETWGRIYSEWFPSSVYEQAEGPEILWNENEHFDSDTFKSEIWIPVRKNR
ncbi:AraC family transcriptional regulator [Sinobaca qinghaiensis]|uniref:AraC family transcriptional regulator n=1 Tax=Sinobaca qinghaiensis TaxID=342944 RepID=A0A419V049_9BACL|nr:AraC family transcriptional regulator [Sinobaca qinghaiensis]RKD71315.1 AraC family transcriptional regulator [Sinobaca qinghaiensis]